MEDFGYQGWLRYHYVWSTGGRGDDDRRIPAYRIDAVAPMFGDVQYAQADHYSHKAGGEETRGEDLDEIECH